MPVLLSNMTSGALQVFVDTLAIPHRTLSEHSVVDALHWIVKTFMDKRVPVALLLKKGIVKGLQP